MVSEGWYIPTPDPKGRTRFPRWVLRISDTHVYYSKGGYLEWFSHRGDPVNCVWRARWRFVFRKPTCAHRLTLGQGTGPSWSLFITGPIVRQWGFHCPQGWRVWTEFVNARDSGQVGRGCE